MDLTAFALALGLVLRLTHLITRDTITAPIRDAIARRFGEDSTPARGIGCPWCMSIWIAIPTAIAAYYCATHPVFVIVCVIAWLAYLTGIAAVWIEGED